MDIPASVRRDASVKASTHIRKFTDVINQEIKERRSKGATYRELMDAYAISSKGTLHYILNNDYITVK